MDIKDAKEYYKLIKNKFPATNENFDNFYK